MRWTVVLCLGVPTLFSGCNIAYYAGRNIVNEPAQTLNQFKLRQRMRAEARAAWQAECARNPGAFSPAFGDGFADGYADHLNNGGTPAPPGAPPAHYRRHVTDFTPAGQAAQRDYLSGFKHGAEAACAAGSRQAVLVPILLPVPQPEQPLNITCIPASPDGRLPPLANPPPMIPPAPPAGVGVPLPLPVPRIMPDPKLPPPPPLPPINLPQSGVGPNVRRPGTPLSFLLEREPGSASVPATGILAGGLDKATAPPRLLPLERAAESARLTAPVVAAWGAEWACARPGTEAGAGIDLPPVSSPP